MTDGQAETALLELVQSQGDRNFTLTISCVDGFWTIAMDDLDTNDGALVGDGDSFAAAWSGIDPR
jgi:hypothetical protein